MSIKASKKWDYMRTGHQSRTVLTKAKTQKNDRQAVSPDVVFALLDDPDSKCYGVCSTEGKNKTFAIRNREEFLQRCKEFKHNPEEYFLFEIQITALSNTRIGTVFFV